MFGGISAAFAASGAKTITASYDDIKIYVNQNRIEPRDANGNAVEPFISDGTTYLPVRAVAESLGQEVSWDGSTKSVYIGTRPEKAAAESAQNKTAGVLTVPNNGDARFVPKAGDRVLCDDGSVYEITRGPDLNAGSGFTANGRRHPEEALPEPTCDWSVYPDLPLPDVEVKRFQNYDSQGIFVDDLYILNLHEMRRVQYTLYNHILPETQRRYRENPGLLKNIEANGKSTDIKDLVGQVRFGYLYYQTQQGFYPWDENEVVKHVRNTPTKMFCVEV
ncbi:MAG: copper amine oxidase N-terminal domain-containing protein, partial [Clostridiales Family XIII bacterium]|nr:copper amine oxidase N-terminal domain-containing protein [Clostridiales Family XIII bacterium]